MPMIINFTKNDVVRELYRETTALENEHLLLARLTDENLQEEMEEMKFLQQELDKVMIKTPAHVTQAIMKAARW